MLAPLFARRYLFSRKSHSVINLIAGLSVAAVAMPVAAMIILLSVFNGFEGLVRSMYSAFDAELTLSPRTGQTFKISALDTAALRTVPGVAALSLMLEQNSLAEHDGRQATVTVRGVDDAYATVFPISGAVSSGEYRVRLGDLESLVIGQAMAYQLGLRSLADADVALYALRRGSFPSLLPLENYVRREVPVDGVFVLDLETEQQYILASLRLSQELFNYSGRASGVVFGLKPGADRESVRRAVATIAGDGFRVRTRDEMKASLYRIMTYEKWGIFFIAALVLLIASFSIVGALSMLIIEKRRDITTLRAMGADRGLIRSIFLNEGWLIGGMGAVVGVVLGVGLSLIQQHFGLIEMPADTFLTKSYPVEFHFADLVAVLAAFAVVTALVSNLTVRSLIKNPKS